MFGQKKAAGSKRLAKEQAALLAFAPHDDLKIAKWVL
jgi:hypothetical protein